MKLKLARKSLKGVSIGDAFGDSFFGETEEIIKHINQRHIPKTNWEFTDDTVMAISIFNQLKTNKEINQKQLAKEFSINYEKDINRGYGATVRMILREICEGSDWREISKSVFSGMGSMGNGASMRVSPIGAYFFDDIKAVKVHVIKSAEITHSNIEAIATKVKLKKESIEPNKFLEKVINELPNTDTKSKI